jgi:lipoprotein NlpD
VHWRWPAQGQVVRHFSPKNGSKGIDIAGRSGQAVNAAAGGRVVYSGSGLRGYGKLIIIKHNNSHLSAYAHNERLLVKEGDTVNGGQRIASMGRAGDRQVKLHFQVRRNGKPVDPLRYLPKR